MSIGKTEKTSPNGSHGGESELGAHSFSLFVFQRTRGAEVEVVGEIVVVVVLDCAVPFESTPSCVEPLLAEGTSADVSILVSAVTQTGPWHSWSVTMASGTSWYCSTNSTSYEVPVFQP